jgi:hypothetical protein
MLGAPLRARTRPTGTAQESEPPAPRAGALSAALCCAARAPLREALFFLLGALCSALLAHRPPCVALACGAPPPPVAPCDAMLPPPALGERLEPVSKRPWPSSFVTWAAREEYGALADVFAERVTAHGSDKATGHRYQYLYAKYLLPLRHRNISVLEIGLGCGMDFGPGHSASFFAEMFPFMTYYSVRLAAPLNYTTPFIPFVQARPAHAPYL